MFYDNSVTDVFFSFVYISVCVSYQQCEMSEVSSWSELWSDGPWLVITVSSCMYPRQTEPWCLAAFTYIKLISVRVSACLCVHARVCVSLWFSLPALSQAVCQYCWHNADISLTLLNFFSLLGVFFSLPPTLTPSSTLSFLFLFFLTPFLCHALVFSLPILEKTGDLERMQTQLYIL